MLLKTDGMHELENDLHAYIDIDLHRWVNVEFVENN